MNVFFCRCWYLKISKVALLRNFFCLFICFVVFFFFVFVFLCINVRGERNRIGRREKWPKTVETGQK